MRHLIKRIEQLPLPKVLVGFSLDLPQAGEHRGLVCPVAGWAFGAVPGVAVDIEVTFAGATLRRLRANLPRPDVQVHFSGNAHALYTGFHDVLALHALPSAGELKLKAKLGLESHDVALIHYEHAFHCPASASETALQPVAVTAVARSGTTWLMHLLSRHPQIVAYPAYPYEFHVGSYFQHLLRVVVSPADFIHSSTPDSFWFEHAYAGHPPFQASPPMDLMELEAWLSSRLWPLTANYAVQATDQFYRSVAAQQGKSAPQFFAEKLTEPWFGWLMRALYSRPKEIFVIRDFRDVFCSVLSFNRRRKFESFGRERVDSDAAYAEWLNAEVTKLIENWRARSDVSLLIRYEDLVLSPEQLLAKIFAYIGVDCSPTLVREVLSLAQQQAPMLAEHMTAQTPARSIGRWRSELSPELARVVNSTFAENLAAVGYAL